jgi:hypothetical protein
MGSKSASPLLRSPIQLTSSLGVNMLARSVAVKRESVIERVASIKRAKMTGSPKTSQHPPSFTQLSSPSLEDLSPGTRTTNSHNMIYFHVFVYYSLSFCLLLMC